MGATRWLDATRQDLRFGWRALRRSPLFTLVAVCSLGLGIGANAVIFGIIHSLLLAKLPVAAPGELRLVSHSAEGPLRAFFASREVEALQANPNVNLATLHPAGVARAEANGTTINGVGLDVVDGAFFRLVAPGIAAGRTINDDDARTAAPVAVVSYAFATVHFGSARTAVTKSVKLNDAAFTVIGVTEASYTGLAAGPGYAMAIPSTAAPLLQAGPPGARGPDAFLVTRLRGDSVRVHDALGATFNACCAQGELADPRAQE